MRLLLLQISLISLTFSQLIPCKKSYKKVPEILEPKLNRSSSISQLFALLKEEQFDGSCYEWSCRSEKYLGQKCHWCLPYVMVAGFSKCGTTAFCDKLSTHPSMKRYRKKEVNIFTKLGNTLSWDVIEERTYERKNNSTGKFYLDCTSGAFRDLQVPLHLKKYSPKTKVIFLVRDPWQRIGSYLEMIKRNAEDKEHYRSQFNRLKDKLRRHSNQPESIRLSSGGIKHIAEVNNFMFIENILTWISLLGSKNVLVIDKFNLEYFPAQTMQQVEEFLLLPSFNYSQKVLYSISSNSLREEDMLESKNKKKSALVLSSQQSSQLSSQSLSGDSIHSPYSFKDKTLLLYTMRLFYPSLCLFEAVLGWQIKIVTPEILRTLPNNEKEEEEVDENDKEDEKEEERE